MNRVMRIAVSAAYVGWAVAAITTGVAHAVVEVIIDRRAQRRRDREFTEAVERFLREQADAH